MKRFLIPFTIAILIHVFLLRLQGDWVQKRLFQAQPAPIALALTYVKPKAPPLPSLPPPQNETREKMQTPEKPQEIPAEKPAAPKPEVVKRKPPKVPKKTKETVVPTPRPEPSPRPALEEQKPLAAPAPSPPTAQETEPGPLVPGPASPQQTLGAPSPPHSDSNSGGERQLAALTPVRALKEAVPIYRRNPPPSYPRIARRKGYEGTVVLEVLVGREGRVSDLRVLQSCGHAVLDEAAADSVRSWLFDPGKLDAEPVEMWVRVPIRFQLKE
jgi:protein TonB